MKRINFVLLVVTVVITIFSCERDGQQMQEYPDATLLLTARPWKLLSYGYDHNGDGIIDSNEISIKDCEKDNVSIFNPDGSGVVLENALICSAGNKVSQFSWALTENNTVLDFTTGAAFITRLSKDDLIITDTVADAVKLMVMYGH
ncbi:MAG: hypothetical protein ABUT20_12065 [Bacteroidota bacterium]